MTISLQSNEGTNIRGNYIRGKILWRIEGGHSCEFGHPCFRRLTLFSCRVLITGSNPANGTPKGIETPELSPFAHWANACVFEKVVRS